MGTKYIGFPFREIRLVKEQQAMNVIGHHDKFIQLHEWKMLRYLQPIFMRDGANFCVPHECVAICI